MMSMLWVVLLVASTGLQAAQGLPLRSTPQIYPHGQSEPSAYEVWGSSGVYAALPALALVVTAVGLLFGCTWCYRHKDCKPNEGTDNQLFTASATHLHDARRSQPPDSGFSEPVNNNISEDNNNGPISLREMQNIANNNAAAYIVSENEERNRISRESVVEFEPLPQIRVADPLERCADWFAGEDLPRNRLQYLREIGRGWFGRVVEGELENPDGTSTRVAVRILTGGARPEHKARFLDEARAHRDAAHDRVLRCLARALRDDPWILVFEYCPMDLQQYLVTNRPKMAILNESGVPLQLMCDVTSALAYLHSRGYVYGNLWSGDVLVRGAAESARAVIGRYASAPPPHDCAAPETRRHPPVYTTSSEVWSVGYLVWEVCAWGNSPPHSPPPPPDLPCPYRNHLYQVMQLCWNPNPEARPTASQVHALINHLHSTHARASEASQDDGYGSSDFEERWQRLKPNTIPKVDEHVAIVHAPSTSMSSSHFTGSDQDFDNAPTIQDTLSVDMDTAVSRSSSIMSDKDPLSVQIKSESLTNLHGSLEDVRNIYLTHNETAALECHQGNMSLEEAREKEHDRSDSSVDPWLKDIITGSQDDVSYYKDVSDVIKNLDNILNSEKTSSSESSHQASPSRDNLSLECKKDYPMQTSMVKSPGISNFQNILDMGFTPKPEESGPCEDDDVDRDTIGTLSHSFERYSDTNSQHTLENLTPDTPMKDLDITTTVGQTDSKNQEEKVSLGNEELKHTQQHSELPKDNKLDNSDSEIPKSMELSVVSIPSISESIIQQVNVKEDCQTPCDNNITEIRTEIKEFEAKSIDDNNVTNMQTDQKLPYEPDTSVDSVAAVDILESQRNFSIDNNTYVIESSVLPDAKEINMESKEPLVNRTWTDNLHSETYVTQSEIEDKLEESPPDIAEVIDNSKEHTGDEGCLLNDDKILSDTVIIESKLNNKESQLSAEITQAAIEDNAVLLTSVEIDESHFGTTYIIPDESQNNDVQLLDDNDTCRKEELSSGVLSTEIIKNESDNQTFNILPNDDKAKKSLEDTVNIVETAPISPRLENTELSNIKHTEFLSETTQELDSIAPIKEVFNTSEAVESILNIDNNIVDVSKQSETTEAPETVQTILHYSVHTEAPYKDMKVEECQNVLDYENSKLLAPSPETVQSIYKDREVAPTVPTDNSSTEDITINDTEFIANRSGTDINDILDIDLINNTNTDVLKDTNTDNNIKDVIQSYLESSSTEEACTLVKNESTVYLDLPSIIKDTDNFLHLERVVSSQNAETQDTIFASTPKSSVNSAETTAEDSGVEHITEILSETKVPDYGPGVSVTKLEQRCVPDSLSPFESPTKSHHTDTYDENSSVVLGPFENCSLEFFKGVKSGCDLVEIPKEELLAFSSNFSEMNLETPSPLRDGNFLNEVPDLQYDDTNTLSEAKPAVNEPSTENNTDETEEQSTTEKRVSPSTPPNSPGNFLATVSQQKFLVDIDVTTPNEAPLVLDAVASSSQNEVDLDLQITTKMAMAENENNMNIEYSGPLTEEGLITEEADLMRDSESVPESYLAGNGGQAEYSRDGLVIDEERMKELRNELELKLPLAQVAAIEPTCSAWVELPPPPELVLNYGALSPIAEETGQQLSAYENDDHWNQSTRTESSESYPEPCNNSADEATELPQPSRDHSTYTIHSKEPSVNHTYTVHKEVPSSKEMTMSADSLNASPFKRPAPEARLDEPKSIDDRTFNKSDEPEEKESCERLSQVSPFLLSPTTDTSAPDNSDNVAGMSTLSKPTVPTDAKSSKPSETQCLSKATSIDSWCSNDTLYNVEENFDDLAMDPDVPLDFDREKSESEDTLTHNEEDREPSHCSTYIIHDSKSEVCETFSPDSITANDNYTYTKVKTDAAGPSVITKSDVNDSTKNTQTKDLAYGTLMSGMPSYSNCTTEVLSGADDPWKLAQPELVRRSPVCEDFYLTPPKQSEEKEAVVADSPHLTEPSLKKMDSVEVTCLRDDSVVSPKSESVIEDLLVHINDSSTYHYKNMAQSVTSTPLTELLDGEDVQPIPMQLPDIRLENTDYLMTSIPNFQAFQQSAGIRPQDLSSNVSDEVHSEVLLEGDSKTLSRNSNRDSLVVSERTPTYSDFEDSAVTKPQDVHSSGISSEDFRQFESSVRHRPQDLSSLIDASSLLLKSERLSSECAMSSLMNVDSDHTSRSDSFVPAEEAKPVVLSQPNVSNLIESHNVDISRPMNIFITDLDLEDENEQPHSIIITESQMVPSKLSISPNRTYDSHTKGNLIDESHNYTYDSHACRMSGEQNISEGDLKESGHPKLNGTYEAENYMQSLLENESPSPKNLEQAESRSKNDSAATTEEDEVAKSPVIDRVLEDTDAIQCNGKSENFATVHFLNEAFEELMESNVDDNDAKDLDLKDDLETSHEVHEVCESTDRSLEDKSPKHSESASDDASERMVIDETVNTSNGQVEAEEEVTSVTQSFLLNEKKFCQFDAYLPLLSDIRFTGPASEIMSTSFTQDSPTDPTSPECEQDSKPDPTADILKEWDSDSDSHSSNSSSGEFIWKDGGGQETALVPTTHFDHQRDSGSQQSPSGADGAADDGASSAGSGDSGSGSGSEGDEVEFVPSSWDCRAAPAKSSLRSLEQPPESKKRVVFKRQKYHCVYEYPREAADDGSPAPYSPYAPYAPYPPYLPDLSTYCEWDPRSAEEAELGYGQLFGAPGPLDIARPAGPAHLADYDEDFFISSSARPFESLGVMSSASQFFPGLKAPPSPPPPPPPPPRAPSLDFTTPDSGVEDVTPADEFATARLPDEPPWRPLDSASSSESVSPSSPSEALGGLRHTRDKLKLDLPPSPHVPSPRHGRVFSFVLDKPRAAAADEAPLPGVPLPLPDPDPLLPEPTFSTFGKSPPRAPEHDHKSIILTDEESERVEMKEEVKEPVKGEGTLLDSGDEDSGIESSSKATLERAKPPPPATPNVS